MQRNHLNTLCIVAASMLSFAGTLHAAEPTAPQKQPPTQKQAAPIDLIELLGELGDDEADLEAAMSSVEQSPNTNKAQQAKPTKTENAHLGAEK